MTTLAVFAPESAMASSVVVAKELLYMAAAEAAVSGHADEVVVVSLNGEPVECGAGVTVNADRSITEVDECALVWVAGYGSGRAAGARANAAALPWLRARHEAGAELVGHGPGAFLLAEAGLLAGRLATTYRAQVPAFRRHHPDVDLQPQRAITDAGGVYCAVGLDSGRDLLVTLIERRYGPEVASTIAAWALNDSERGYRSAASAFDGQRYHGDEDVLRIQDWLEQNYREPISVEMLAQRFAMSSRTLTRRFRAATGDSPSEYLRRIRVESAKDLLLNSQLTVAEVATDVGYRDIGAFYDAFTHKTGQRPGAFRNAEWVAPWDENKKGTR